MRSSTAATVERGDPVGKLVSFGRVRKYRRCVGTWNVPVMWKEAKSACFRIIKCRRMNKKVTSSIIRDTNFEVSTPVYMHHRGLEAHTFIVYCQFLVPKYCLSFMSNVNLLTDPLAYSFSFSAIRQVHILFQSEFSTDCDLVLRFSIFCILSFPYGHPVDVYIFFFVFPSLLSCPSSCLQLRVLEVSSCTRCD